MEQIAPTNLEQVVVRLGLGDDTFSAALGSPFSISNETVSTTDLVGGDFNGDDAPDFAAAYSNEGAIRLLDSQIDLSSDPVSVDFGDVAKGNTASTKHFSILNSGGPPATIDEITLSGPDAGKFQLPAQCAGQAVTSSGGCQQDVKFTPDTIGSYSATVHVTFDGTTETMDVPLAANVVVPRASVDPAELDFGEVRINQRLNQTITVTSTGDLPVSFDAATISGTNANDFAFTSNTCTGEAIDPGETCEVKLNGIPSVIGTRTAQLNLPNDGYQSAQTVALSVEGVNPGMLVARATTRSTSATSSRANRRARTSRSSRPAPPRSRSPMSR